MAESILTLPLFFHKTPNVKCVSFDWWLIDMQCLQCIIYIDINYSSFFSLTEFIAEMGIAVENFERTSQANCPDDI